MNKSVRKPWERYSHATQLALIHLGSFECFVLVMVDSNLWGAQRKTYKIIVMTWQVHYFKDSHTQMFITNIIMMKKINLGLFSKHVLDDKNRVTHWYVSNVSIIFDVPCCYYVDCHMFWLHFILFLCIFWD